MSPGTDETGASSFISRQGHSLPSSQHRDGPRCRRHLRVRPADLRGEI